MNTGHWGWDSVCIIYMYVCIGRQTKARIFMLTSSHVYLHSLWNRQWLCTCTLGPVIVSGCVYILMPAALNLWHYLVRRSSGTFSPFDYFVPFISSFVFHLPEIQLFLWLSLPPPPPPPLSLSLSLSHSTPIYLVICLPSFLLVSPSLLCLAPPLVYTIIIRFLWWRLHKGNVWWRV